MSLLTFLQRCFSPRVQQKVLALSASVVSLEQARLATERALREHQAMLNNEMVGIVKVRQRTVLWANPAFEAMTGYAQAQIVGASTRLFYADEATFLKLADAYEAMAKGGIYRVQTEMQRRDGSRIWVDLSGAMLAPELGESLWIFLDITERRQAEAVREAAAERLHKLSQRVPGMVYQYLLRPDGSSCMPFASEAIRNIYRVTPQEVVHDAAIVFTRGHPDDVPAVQESIRQSALHLTPWQHEYRVRFDDGTVRWLFGNALPERLEDGAVLWHGFITDITERKAADDRLRQLSLSVEQAPVSIVITDLQGSILYANPSFTRNTGYTLEEAKGQNPRILKSGLTPPRTYQQLWDTVSSGGVWQGELHNRRKNGELFIEHAVIAPVQGANGQTSFYVAVKEDITLRKQADLALQASLKDKVALLNEVHHRVKNNLQVITSLLRLEAGRSSQSDTHAVLKDMQGRIYAMALLHETLYRSGTFASVELGAYLKQMATQAFRAQARQGTHQVRLTVNVASVDVQMDQATPCGLLVNELLSNCLKHAFPDGRAGEVLVQLQPLQPAQPDSLWCLAVRDNGVGLPVDWQARSAQSLGLQLVSDLARQLGGTLRTGDSCLASQGSGAVFSVEFAVQVFHRPN